MVDFDEAEYEEKLWQAVDTYIASGESRGRALKEMLKVAPKPRPEEIDELILSTVPVLETDITTELAEYVVDAISDPLLRFNGATRFSKAFHDRNNPSASLFFLNRAKRELPALNSYEDKVVSYLDLVKLTHYIGKDYKMALAEMLAMLNDSLITHWTLAKMIDIADFQYSVGNEELVGAIETSNFLASKIPYVSDENLKNDLIFDLAQILSRYEQHDQSLKLIGLIDPVTRSPHVKLITLELIKDNELFNKLKEYLALIHDSNSRLAVLTAIVDKLNFNKDYEKNASHVEALIKIHIQSSQSSDSKLEAFLLISEFYIEVSDFKKASSSLDKATDCLSSVDGQSVDYYTDQIETLRLVISSSKPFSLF